MNIGPFVTAMSRANRPEGQMDLGGFVDALESIADKSKEVVFDFCSLRPLGFISWRGIYADLALEYTHEGSAPTVASVLDMANATIGTVLEGYKGGDFRMDQQTPLWVDNYGESNSTAIVGVEDCGWRVVIHTKWMEA